MSTRPPLSDPAVKALAWLLNLAAARAGYTVLGLPGWASADEIESGVRGWGTHELIRAQARRRRVVEYDGRAPGETRVRWLCRISQHGLDEIARTLGVVSVTAGDLGQRTETDILRRDSTQAAIPGLRAALDPRAKPRREWVEGQTGWNPPGS